MVGLSDGEGRALREFKIQKAKFKKGDGVQLADS